MVQLKVKTDVLVIGGGGAGLRAAIAAADCGAQVILVSKRKVGIAGATAFPVAEMAGYNAGDIRIPGDTQSHYEDIMKAAQGMADPKLAAITAANAPGTISKLEEWGVEFEHVEDDYYIFKSCFSRSPRTHVIKGHGEPIIKALMKQIELRKENIRIMDDVTIFQLVKKNDRVCGAIGCREEKLLKIEAGAVVMATGGCGQAFSRNMNPVDITGDGYAMAYETGAELINMEFMQIGMGFSWPVVNIFNGYIWEGKPSLTDREGKVILKKYSPIGELGTLAGIYADSLSKTLDCTVCITDTDQVIAAAGNGKKELQEMLLSAELAEVFQERKTVLKKSSDAEFVAITKDRSEYSEEIISVILSEGDIAGGVIFLQKNEKKHFGEMEKKFAAGAADLLGRQLS